MSNSTPTPSSTGRPLPSDQVGACLTALDDVLDKAVDAPVWSLEDARLSRRLADALAVRARVDELVARLVGQGDERDLAKVMGASSTKAHPVASYRVSGAAAAGLVSQARCLTDRTDVTRQACRHRDRGGHRRPPQTRHRCRRSDPDHRHPGLGE